MKHQAGFTLVEIAIVMVIIGLLIGGILKGQEIITNAKIGNVEKEFNNVSVAIYNYQDRYRALPGDDTKAMARFGVKAGDGDWIIDEVFDSTKDDDESRLFWAHLRSAGLITGGTTDQTQPNHPFQGIIGVSTGAATTGTAGITGLFVGFKGIPGDIAEMLDTRTDDSEPNLGSVHAAEKDAVQTTAATAYAKDKEYNLYYAL